MSLEQLKKDVCAAVDGMAEELLALSHAIHAEPELALEEFKAAERLTNAVESHGIQVQREAFGLKTGYAAAFGKAGGPNIAILSEYDALPGIGHACGHNIIATSGYGAAIALSKLNGRLPGRVRYLGTPAEERFGGKEIMAREGAFDGTDAAMMIHPSNQNLVTMPCIAIAEVEAIFHGRAAHASAMPYRGLNALDAVVTAYQAIAQLRQHIRNTDRIHGIITEGGPRAEHRAGARGVPVLRARGRRARTGAAEGAGAEMLRGGRARHRLHAGGALGRHRLSRPQDQLADGGDVRDERGGARPRILPVKDLPPGYAGSTDMGNVSHRVPSIHPMLGVAPAGVIIHNPEFARYAASPSGDAAVLDGAKSLAMTALDLMADAGRLAAARADFAATAELSAAAIARSREPLKHDHHGHGGCGCA